jgi:hypothetical protein
MPGSSSLGLQEYPTNQHVFFAHFVLTRAHLERTSRSVTYRSRPSTLNLGVLSGWASGKEVATCWYVSDEVVVRFMLVSYSFPVTCTILFNYTSK